VPDKNADVDSMNSIVENGKGSQAAVRNDYDTVERTGEEHKGASTKDESKVHALNILAMKLDTNCNKGSGSDAPERSSKKIHKYRRRGSRVGPHASTFNKTETFIRPTKGRPVRRNRQVRTRVTSQRSQGNVKSKNFE